VKLNESETEFSVDIDEYIILQSRKAISTPLASSTLFLAKVEAFTIDIQSLDF
jgi:hypothetical protein